MRRVSCRPAVSEAPVMHSCDSARARVPATAFGYRGRSATESSSALTRSGPSQTTREQFCRPQQRMMQNRDDVCRLTASAVEAPQGAPRGWNCAAVKDSGKADQSDCGDNGTQFDGRSRVIHTLRNGFREIGAESGLLPAITYSTDAVARSGCARLASRCTCWTACVHACGSGRTVVV